MRASCTNFPVQALMLVRERSLTIGGGGSVLFQRLEPKNVSPSQVNSPKILAPFKM